MYRGTYCFLTFFSEIQPGFANHRFLRIQLIDLINKYRPKRVFKLDDMLRNDPKYKIRNIEILRTPQYHPELQPIEKCWACMKQYMAQHCDFTLKGLHKNLEIAWTKVIPETMKEIILQECGTPAFLFPRTSE